MLPIFSRPFLSIIVLCSIWLPGFTQRPALYFKQLNEENGLSNYHAFDLLQDRTGFIWIASSNGLNRFDGYRNVKWHHDPDVDTSISSNQINALAEDGMGRVWIGAVNGLNLYRPETDDFQRFLNFDGQHEGLVSGRIQDLLVDRQQRLWIVTDRGVSRATGKIPKFRTWPGFRGPFMSIYEDKSGTIWLIGKGLYRYDEQQDRILKVPVIDHETDYNFRTINCMRQADDAHYWLGTRQGLWLMDKAGNASAYLPEIFKDQIISDMALDHEGRLWTFSNFTGMSMVSREQNQVYQYRSNAMNAKGLPTNQLDSALVDRTGVIWVGSIDSGVIYFSPKQLQFGLYRSQPGSKQSLKPGSHWALLAENDIYWLGNDQGLSRWDTIQQKVNHFKISPDKDGIQYNRIRSLLRDSDGTLWAGTRSGLARFEEKQERFTVIEPDSNDPEGLPGGNIRDLLEDKNGRIWQASFGGGLSYLADKEKNRFVRFQENTHPIAISSRFVRCLYEDEDGILWVGTQNGLNRIHLEAERVNYYFKAKNPDNVTGRSGIMCIHEDSHGFFWLGTIRGGLIRFHPKQNRISYFDQADGLPSNYIYGILEDEHQRLWISTERGLACLDRDFRQVRTFHTSDGLQGMDFSSGSYFKASDGTMMFGGGGGINIFHPRDIEEERFAPTTVLTSLRIDGQLVGVSRPGYISPLNEPLQQLKTLDLAHDDNIFSFNFAGLHFNNPAEHRYAYILEGFDKDWRYVGADNRVATYTNLPARRYTFRVKSATRTGPWDDRGPAVAITVAPSPWRTWWAYTLYMLALVGLFAYYVHTQRQKLVHERKVIERLRQVDRMRDDFLANTSHELRTPLNGMIGLAESMLDSHRLEIADRENLRLIVSIGQRLSSLVNDILDFAQLRNESVTLDFRPVDLHSTVDVALTLARTQLESKTLSLKNQIPAGLPPVYGDEDRILQILHNLIGNAVKFTESGEVQVRAYPEGKMITVSISDTGIGISPRQYKQIFESFRQAEEGTARIYSGTGLGLAICRELVHLHGGRIWVESQEGKGATFFFSLPLYLEKSEPSPTPMRTLTTVNELPPISLEPLSEALSKFDGFRNGSRFHILVVDDETVNCRVVTQQLAPYGYRLTAANSGPDALRMIKENGPFDLVLLDIMMPHMSGFEVCARLRKEYPPHELPIIFLSAKNRIADLTMGFESGANDYLTKPISKDELVSRVRTHLQLLDTNRNLEEKIVERTQELEEKNAQIVRTQNQLIMQEKMAYLGSMASGVAHEIRNPLNFVHGLSLVSKEILVELEEEVSASSGNNGDLNQMVADLRQNLDVILKNGRRANAIVENMMTISRESDGTLEAHDIATLLTDQAKLVYRDLLSRGGFFAVKIQHHYEEDIPRPKINARDMGRVFTSLVKNAMESMREKHEMEENYEACLDLSIAREEGMLVLRIRDNGMGIADENLARIFDPFFTTRPPDSGHIGLGLSFSFDVVTQEHGGKLEVVTEKGRFAEFIIKLLLD